MLPSLQSRIIAIGTGERKDERMVRNSDGSLTKLETTTVVTRKADGTIVTKRKILRKTTPPPPGGRLSDSDTGSTVRRCKTPPPGALVSGQGRALERMKDAMNCQVKTHADNATFEAAAVNCIPSEFLLIASQDEVTQAQEDYFALDHYENLPALTGEGSSRKMNRAGSVATCALLEMMYKSPAKYVSPQGEPMNCHQVLQCLQKRIKQASKINNAKPTISSSRPLGPPRRNVANYAPFTLVSPKATGTRRALLIGVVSGGQGGDLKAPPNDVALMHHFLTTHGGFKAENIAILLENPTAAVANAKTQPTKANILAEFAKLVRSSTANDAVVVQFSGHGGRSTHNLHLVPSDYHPSGPIHDEDIMKDLIKAMPANVYTTMLVDCCFSGTLGDLPYVLKSGAVDQEIEIFFDTDTRQEMLQKERMGGEAYQKWKRNRASQRFLMNLSPMKMMEDAATAASQAASAAGLAATQTAQNMSEAAKRTSSAATEAAKRTSSAATEAAAAAVSQGVQRASAAAGNAAVTAKESAMGAVSRLSDVASLRFHKDGDNPQPRSSEASTASTASTSTIGSSMSAISAAASNATAAMRRGAARTVSSDGALSPRRLMRTKSAEEANIPFRRAGKKPTKSSEVTRSMDGTTASPTPGRKLVGRAMSSDGMSAVPLPRRGGKKPALRTKSDDGAVDPNRPTPVKTPVGRAMSSDGMSAVPLPRRGGKKPAVRTKSDDGAVDPNRPTRCPMRVRDAASKAPTPLQSRGSSPVPARSPMRTLPSKVVVGKIVVERAAAAEEAARNEAVERSKREAAAARAAARAAKA